MYLERIQKRHELSDKLLDEILRSHLIEPEHLRNDDFEAFYAARTAALSDLVGSAMDKPVVDEHGHNEEVVDAEYRIDTEDDIEEAA